MQSKLLYILFHPSQVEFCAFYFYLSIYVCRAAFSPQVLM